MSIADAVAQVTDARYCKFGQILTELAGPDFQAITDGLENGLTKAGAARILRANGHAVDEKVIRKHVAGECRCKVAA